MVKRWLKSLCGMVIAAAAFMPTGLAADDTVKIGILHSLSGTMAISETSLKDAVLMAVGEINAKGGVLGKKIEPVVVDPAQLGFVRRKGQAVDHPGQSGRDVRLLDLGEPQVGAAGVRGIRRAAVLSVQYEGEEQSLNVFYTGASPNEQLIPAAEYMMMKAAAIRSSTCWERIMSSRDRQQSAQGVSAGKGVPEENIIEEYTPFHHQDYQTIVGKIKEFATGGKACVLSTINGDSNVPFYKEFANQGLTAADCPIMAFSVAEDELRAMDVPPLVGHLACWNYFQSIDTPENKKFVADFKAYCKNKLPGGDGRVTDDPIEAAYFGVYVWKAAAEKAGSFDVDKVREAVYGMKFDAPGGPKMMDAKNQHTWKTVYIGEIQKDGQFKIVWQSQGSGASGLLQHVSVARILRRFPGRREARRNNDGLTDVALTPPHGS